MLAVGHTAIGIAIGLAVPEPVAAFGLGVFSHHLADTVPHFDPGSFLLDKPWHPRSTKEYTARDWIFVSIDAVLTLGLLIGAFVILPVERRLAVGAAILGALLPDLVHNIPFWSPGLRKITWIRGWQDHIHRRFQITVPARHWLFGSATQVVPIGLVVWYMLSVRG